MSNGLDPVQFLTIIGLISPRAIAVETNGSLIVVDRALRAVTRLDPHTGQASLVSDATTSADRPFMDPLAIAVEPDGRLAVVDGGRQAVIRVEPNGIRTIVSDASTGLGPRFEGPVAIAVEKNGFLVVVDRDLKAVFRVDPRTGDRTIASGCPAIDAQGQYTGALIGQGPAFERPVAIAVEENGALMVVDRDLKAVFRVDPRTGDRTIVSGCPAIDAQGQCTGALIGQGPGLVAPVGVAVEAGGSLVVVDTIPGSSSPGAVIRVNPANGDRTIVSDATIGDGPPLNSPSAIAREANGALVVVDPRVFSLGAAPPALFRVDPRTGNRTLIAEGATERGSGSLPAPAVVPPLNFPSAIAREADGALAVVGGVVAMVRDDFTSGAVIRVDPRTGNRRIASGCPAIDARGQCTGALIGQGPGLVAPVGVAVEAGGSLVVVDVGLQAVIRVDPVSGDRRIVSGCPAIDAQGQCTGALIGQGPRFAVPGDIAVEANGQLVVLNLTNPADDLKAAVVRVDPKGDRTIVSDATVGHGPYFAFPQGIAVEADGQLVVADTDLRAILRVDPVSGDRTIVSGCPAIDAQGQCTGALIGQGQALAAPVGVAVEAGGSLVVVDVGLQAVIRVDPVSGDRTLVSRSR